MGLDMWANAVRPGLLTDADQVDFQAKVEGTAADADKEELRYWRKHGSLHQWMERLYRRKDGTAEEFNCIPVRLMLADLDELEAAVLAGEFGGDWESDPDDDLRQTKYRVGDVAFVCDARRAIREGRAVYYISWW